MLKLTDAEKKKFIEDLIKNEHGEDDFVTVDYKGRKYAHSFKKDKFWTDEQLTDQISYIAHGTDCIAAIRQVYDDLKTGSVTEVNLDVIRKSIKESLRVSDEAEGKKRTKITPLDMLKWFVILATLTAVTLGVVEGCSSKKSDKKPEKEPGNKANIENVQVVEAEKTEEKPIVQVTTEPVAQPVAEQKPAEQVAQVTPPEVEEAVPQRPKVLEDFENEVDGYGMTSSKKEALKDANEVFYLFVYSNKPNFQTLTEDIERIREHRNVVVGYFAQELIGQYKDYKGTRTVSTKEKMMKEFQDNMMQRLKELGTQNIMSSQNRGR